MWGSLVSAGANLLGGLLGRSDAKDAREQSNALAEKNIALQREFAQSGIQWRVEDAKKAGIHPIYALGGSGASFSPVSANFTADTSLPNAMAAAGQDIGRAINATRTEKDRMGAFQKTAQALSLEKAGLENELLRTEIASKTGRLRQAANPPMASSGDAYLVPGQTQSGLIKQKPLEVAPAPTNAPSMEGGAIIDTGFARTPTGWAPIPGKDIKERIEDNLPQELSHFWRNNILPHFSQSNPPPVPLPPDHKWFYNVLKMEWQQIPNRSIPRKSGF